MKHVFREMNNRHRLRPRLQRGTTLSAENPLLRKKVQFLCWQKWLQSHANASTNKKRSGLIHFTFLLDISDFFFRAGWKAVSACSGMVLSRTYLTKTGGCHCMLPPQSLMWGMCLAPTAFAGWLSQVASNPRRAHIRNNSCDCYTCDLHLCLVVTMKRVERRKNIAQHLCTRDRWPGKVRSLV